MYYFFAEQNNPITESLSFLPVLALMLYLVTFCWGLSFLPYTIMSELFPIEVKVIAAPIVTAFAWLMSFFVTR
jgi:hypothetical protein